MNLQLPAVNNIKTRSLIYNQIIIMNHKRTYKRGRGEAKEGNIQVLAVPCHSRLIMMMCS